MIVTRAKFSFDPQITKIQLHSVRITRIINNIGAWYNRIFITASGNFLNDKTREEEKDGI